jgi:amino acid permease
LEASTSGDAKNNFKKYKLVLLNCLRTFTSSLSVITFLYILFGVCGYLSFGADTRQMITLNLPEGIFPKFVISCLCYSLFFTYPVMMFPVTRILEKRLCDGNGNSNKGFSHHLRGTVLRVGVVLISAGVVLLIPNFSLLMAFVGSGCCTLLAFILPGIFHWKLCHMDMKWYEKVIDVVLILFGVLGTVIGLQDAFVRLHEYHTSSPSINMTDQI